MLIALPDVVIFPCRIEAEPAAEASVQQWHSQQNIQVPQEWSQKQLQTV